MTESEQPSGAVATGDVGMEGRLLIQVIRAHPTLRQRVADAIWNFLRRHLPS